MTEQQYFKKLDSLIAVRDQRITNHFHNNFLEAYMDADERVWYKKNVGVIDSQIVALCNEISVLLKLNIKFKKIAEVFKCKKLTSWYVSLKSKQSRESEK